MSPSPLRALAAAAALALAAGALHAGQTWIVDDDGGAGVHFTDIPPAIAAAAAGDTLLVQDGSYSSFSLTKPLTIVGYGTVDARQTSDPVFLAGIGPGQTAVIDNVTTNAVQVYGCFGTVILSSCVGRELTALLADDLRLHGCDFAAGLGGGAGVSVMDSRAEMVASQARGGIGYTTTCTPSPRPHGLAIGTLGRVHAVDLIATGGEGAHVGRFCTGSAGDGGHGATVDTTSALIAVGGTYQGGHGGYHNGSQSQFPGCKSGLPGKGIDACAGAGGGLVRDTDVTTAGGGSETNACTWYWTSGLCANNHVLPAGGDPKLTLAGSTVAGNTVTFTVAGPVGADVLLFLGRKPKLIPEPGVEIELLTTMSVNWPLGTIPASGVLTRSYKIRPLNPGFTFYSQAELTLEGGEVRRTNSVPLIVR